MTETESAANEQPRDLGSELKALGDLVEDQERTITRQVGYIENLECRLTREMRKSRAARTALKKVRTRLKHVTGVADDLLAANKKLVIATRVLFDGHGELR